MIALALLVATAAPTPSDAELVSSLVAAAASKDARLDVLSAADVRNAVDLEAQRAIMGCDETSCLLEVAGAMNARLVVHGTLGALGDIVVLTLSAFDTTTASSVGRVVLQESRVDGLAGKIQGAVDELLVRAPAVVAGGRVRTVVLDVKLATPATTSSAPAPGDPPAAASPPWASIALFGVGVVGLGVGVAADAIAFADLESVRKEPAVADGAALAATREVLVPVAVVGYALGVVAIAAGGVLLFIGGE